jgi:hypothetical protein
LRDEVFDILDLSEHRFQAVLFTHALLSSFRSRRARGESLSRG